MKYRAVVFDLDGTLTNTLHDIAAAMNRSLRMHGLPEYPVDAYRYLVGNGAKKLAERAVGDRLDMQEAVLRDYQAYYEQHTRDTTRPYDGIPELLQGLSERGMMLCVLSNKPHADTVNVVRYFFPHTAFRVIRGQMEGVPVKPDPAGALAIAEEIGVQPRECLYLGDTSVDMETATRAGMTPVGVLWGFRDERELRESGARLLLRHPTELLCALDSGLK